MTHTNAFFRSLIALFLLLSVAGCSLEREDVGPYQADDQTYSFSNFDRLEMGSAFKVTVQQGATFSISAEGDRRNLDDLDVYVRNGTLHAEYRNSRNRKYQTNFAITMPTLRGVDFSGAVRSTVTGFTGLNNLDVKFSGASEGTFTVQATQLTMDLSGASSLRASGSGKNIAAELSGASVYNGFGYPTSNGTINVSGASKAHVNVTDNLVIDASGASKVRYMGSPSLRQNTSGASTVERE
ncbi:head GIN domain-containing protein [Spirosoma daeguense]